MRDRPPSEPSSQKKETQISPPEIPPQKIKSYSNKFKIKIVLQFSLKVPICPPENTQEETRAYIIPEIQVQTWVRWKCQVQILVEF